MIFCITRKIFSNLSGAGSRRRWTRTDAWASSEIWEERLRCVLTSETGKRVRSVNIGHVLFFFFVPRRQCSPLMSFRVLYPFQPAWILVAANSTARGSNLLGSERKNGDFLDVIIYTIFSKFGCGSMLQYV